MGWWHHCLLCLNWPGLLYGMTSSIKTVSPFQKNNWRVFGNNSLSSFLSRKLTEKYWFMKCQNHWTSPKYMYILSPGWWSCPSSDSIKLTYRYFWIFFAVLEFIWTEEFFKIFTKYSILSFWGSDWIKYRVKIVIGKLEIEMRFSPHSTSKFWFVNSTVTNLH